MSDFKWMKEVLRDEPITACGVTLYPITVEHYAEFTACADVLALQKKALKKARYVLCPFIEGIFLHSMDRAEEKENENYFLKFLTIFHLALRDERDFREFLRGIFFDRGEDFHLRRIIVVQDGKAIEIPLRDFNIIKEILTVQNGLEIPDEKANPELIEDQKKLAEMRNDGKFKIEPKYGDLLASVAFQSQIRERDLYDWTIREFQARWRAIDREHNFRKFALAEIAGALDKETGNPAPSWCFDAKDESFGTVEISKMENVFKNLTKG